MAADVKAPPLREFPGAPQALVPGAMAASKPYVANDKMQQALGFPGELADGWQKKAIGRMGELLDKYRSLKVYLDACVHCGACADKCHYFIGTQDPLNMPVARQDLMRSVYRRYFTLPGKLFPKLVGARDLTKDVLDQWYTLLQPVLRMPPLLGVLPLRHRHRRSDDGGQGDHGRRRPRAEVLERDHRQGPPDRQQPRPPGAGARRTRSKASPRT